MSEEINIFKYQDIRTLIFKQEFIPKCCKKMKDWTNFDIAATKGYIDIFIWHHKNNTLTVTSDTINFAAINGHINIIEWLVDNKISECTDKTLRLSILKGQFDIVKWIYLKYPEFFRFYNITSLAIHSKQFEIFKWLVKTANCEINDNTFSSAIRDGNIDIVKFIYNHTDKHYYMLISAIEHGNIAVLSWLINKYKPDYTQCDLFYYASKSGNLNVLIWLKNNTYAICRKNSLEIAIANKHTHCVDWLWKNHIF